MKNKLLNFTICQILVVIGVLASCARCQQQKTQAAENVTHFDRSFEKLLSRRKRFLVWRPGSNLLLTGSLVKPLAFPKPSGHNLILEWDIFYPLPDSWRKPKLPTPKPPPPPPPTTTHETIIDWDPHADHDDHSDESQEAWMPEGGWETDDVLKNIADEKEAERRYWSKLPRPQSRVASNNLFRSPSSSPVTQYQNPLLYNRQWQQAAQVGPLSRNNQNNFNQQYYQSNRQSPPYAERNFIANSNNQQPANWRKKGRSLNAEGPRADESMDDNWEHHYAHRDRRDLYERIETTSPLSSFDIKSCLLRAICEAQNFLHPPGYSLLQDMLRAVFTIPIREGMDDDYSVAMQTSDQDCLSVYNEKCPMSILAFLLRSKN